MSADAGPAQAILSAITEAAGSGRSVAEVLTGLAEAAREIAGATYAAIGIPEPEGDAFAAFIHVGMEDRLVAEMGPLPRTHGMLDAMLHDPEPFRTPDITLDPRFRGWWPAAHPRMRSFLGVPIVSRGDVIGAFYLTDKVGADAFTADDEASIRMLATHAAAVIETARLFEDSRTLALVEERERMARELHDALNQSLFSLTLNAKAALSHLRSDPDRAAQEMAEVVDLARRAMSELRTVIDGLRSPDLERDGLVGTIRRLADLLATAHRISIEVSADEVAEPDLETAHEVFRVVQEALTNAVRHARAATVRVELGVREGTLCVTVTDDGKGFDPGARLDRGRRLGLTSMRERAVGLGGEAWVVSAPGAGTTVGMEVPL